MQQPTAKPLVNLLTAATRTIVPTFVFALFLTACSNKEQGQSNSAASEPSQQEVSASSKAAQDASTQADASPAGDARMDASLSALSMDNGLQLGVLERRSAQTIGSREAPAGSMYLALKIRLFNGGTARFSFIDRQFELQNKAGSVQIKPELFAPDPDFGGSGTLMPGMAREGWMVFRVPAEQADASASASWQLGLAPELGEVPTQYLEL